MMLSGNSRFLICEQAEIWTKWRWCCALVDLSTAVVLFSGTLGPQNYVSSDDNFCLHWRSAALDPQRSEVKEYHLAWGISPDVFLRCCRRNGYQIWSIEHVKIHALSVSTRYCVRMLDFLLLVTTVQSIFEVFSLPVSFQLQLWPILQKSHFPS